MLCILLLSRWVGAEESPSAGIQSQASPTQAWSNPYTTQVPDTAWASIKLGQSFDIEQYTFSSFQGGTSLFEGEHWSWGANLDFGLTFLQVPQDSRSALFPTTANLEFVLRRSKQDPSKSIHLRNGIRFGLLHGYAQQTFWNSPLDSSGHFSVFHTLTINGTWLDVFCRIDWGFNSISRFHALVATNASVNIVQDVLAIQLGSLFGYYHHTQPYHLSMSWRPTKRWEISAGGLAYASNLFQPLMDPEYLFQDSFSIEAIVSVSYRPK